MRSTDRRQPPSGSNVRVLLAVALALTACQPAKLPSDAGAAALANATVPADGVYYCTEVSPPWAQWECLGQVSPELAKRRTRVTRVTVRGGRRLSEEKINGHGAPVFAPEATLFYTHDDRGRVIGERVLDGWGVERTRFTYAPDGTRSERRNVWGELSRFGEEDDTWVVAVHERDGQGRRIGSRYQDGSGAPRTVNGDATEVRIIPSQGSTQPGTFARFGPSGQPADDAGGVHRIVDSRGPWGQIGTRFFAADGSPAQRQGRWGWDRHLDAIGNIVRVDNVDVRGNLIASGGEPARTVFVLNEHGDRVEERRFRADGSPLQSGGAPIVRKVFDARGLATVTSYVDAEGRPSRFGNFARVEHTYDSAGAMIEERLFRADGQPGHHTLGDRYAVIKITFDERHNRVEAHHYAADGSPGVDANGVTRALRKYHHDKLIEAENRGPQGELVAVNGAARIKYLRDATGMLVGRVFEDANGNVVKGYDYHAFWIGYGGSEKPGGTRTREEAQARAERLRVAAIMKWSFTQAGVAFADDPDSTPLIGHAGKAIRPEIAAALEALPPGGITGVIDTPAGFFVARRLR